MFTPPEIGRIDVTAVGSPNNRIALVGDFTDGFDHQSRKPFSGPGGLVLQNCLHQAGLITGELYITNLIKQRSDNRAKFFVEKNGRGHFTDEGMAHVYALQAELSEVKANVIVACGSAAFAALCSLDHLSMYRGYVFESTLLPGRKVIPTHHPKSAMRGMYIYRYMIASDLRKAKEESFFPDIRRPERELVYTYDTSQDALDWLQYYTDAPIVGFDIEVINYEVSCISFSSEPERACVIPIADRWTIDEELLMWRGVQSVLGNPLSQKVIQNGMFDIPFLLTRNGIVVRGEIHDTMIGHSILYPELNKGLGFLGSIYCGSQEYWKDTVKFKNIKDES
jgi:uracil-DNA glycosylase family 4